MAAHDLRTPLAAIKMMAEGIARRWQAGREPTGAEWAATIFRISSAADSGFSLIDDLLAVERLTMNGRVGAGGEAIDVEAVVREALALHEDSLRRARCKVTLVRKEPRFRSRTLGPRVPSPDLLEPTSKRDQARTGRTRAGHAHAAGTRLGVVFADSGSGLPPIGDGPAPRIARTAPGAESHGLGLWIVRRAVENLHGRLIIRNSPGRGVAFDIELPGLQA